MDTATRDRIVERHKDAIRSLTIAIKGLTEEEAADKIMTSSRITKIKNVNDLPIVKVCQWMNQQSAINYKSKYSLAKDISTFLKLRSESTYALLCKNYFVRLEYKEKPVPVPTPAKTVESAVRFPEIVALIEKTERDLHALKETLKILERK